MEQCEATEEQQKAHVKSLVSEFHLIRNLGYNLESLIKLD